MAWISSALRAVVLAIGISAIGTGAALACDNCERHDGGVTYNDGRGDGYRYRDGGPQDRAVYNDGRGDGYRYRDGGPQDRYDGDRRDGWHEDGCRDDGCRHTADGCRDNCRRHYDGCRDGCGHRYGGCHDRCGGYAENYSCRSGFYDCRYEDGYDNDRYRERYYDRHPAWTGGGAYGFYGQ